MPEGGSLTQCCGVQGQKSLPLHYAIAGGDHDTVQQLLESKADANAVDDVSP